MNYLGVPCPRCGKPREEYADDDMKLWTAWCDNITAGKGGCGLFTYVELIPPIRRGNEVVRLVSDEAYSHSWRSDDYEVSISWLVGKNETTIQSRNANWVMLNYLLPLDVSMEQIEQYILLS